MSTNESHISGAQLQDEGWTRRFTALGRRLNEVAELYRELGFEVRLEPLVDKFPECMRYTKQQTNFWKGFCMVSDHRPCP